MTKKKTAETADSKNLAQNEATQETAQEAKVVEFKPAESTEVAVLRNEIERLRSLLLQNPDSIEEKIKYFQRKQELIARLKKMDNYITSIEDAREEIEEEIQEDVFISDSFSLRLVRKSGYSSESDLFKFSNPDVINEVLNFIFQKMEAKRITIEQEITSI